MAQDEFCFVNNYTHTVDAQRRFAIPSEWRNSDSSTRFVLLPAKEGVIQAIPLKTFQEEILAKAKKMSLANAASMRALAILGSRALNCECDKQGRIQLTERLMRHASITDKAVLVGSLWCIQILSPEKWNAVGESDDEAFFDIMESINETPDALSGILKELKK